MDTKFMYPQYPLNISSKLGYSNILKPILFDIKMYIQNHTVFKRSS